MNKKVLTLCAGVLLVGGSAVFTVNAVNAGNGKAQTAYVGELRAATGYTLEVAGENATTSIWSLTVTEKKGSLSFTAEGKSWYLTPDGIQSTVKEFTLEEGSGAIIFDGDKNAYLKQGEKLYLWTKSGKTTSKLTTLSKKNNVILATATEVAKELDATDSQVVVYTESTFKLATFNGSDIVKNDANAWILDEDGLFSNTQSGTTNYIQLKNDGTISVTTTKDDASKVTYDGTILLLDGKPIYIVNADGSNKLTVMDSEDAKPVVLYKIDTENSNKVDVMPLAEAATAGTYLIAEYDSEEAPGISYVNSAIESLQPGAPGAEYGQITGVSINEDGVLNFNEAVNTVDIPVVISYKLGDKTYYLTYEGEDLVWGETATTWILSEGKLYDMAAMLDADLKGYDAKPVAENIQYTDNGITGENVPSMPEQAIDKEIALAQTAKPAKEYQNGNCENYLRAATSSDYVYVGGYYNGKHYFFTKDSKLTDDITEAELWMVDKTTENKGRYGYTFLSRTDLATGTKTYLKVDGATRFTGWNYNYGTQLVATDNTVTGPLVFVNNSGTIEAEIDATGVNASIEIGLYESNIASFSAHWLVHRYGSSFKLNFTNHKDYTNKTWVGNVFEDADLVPVLYDTKGFWWNWDLEDVAPENDPRGNYQAFLLKDRNSGLYIALNVSDKYSNTNDFVDGGYPFELLSESNIEEVLRTGKVNGTPYYPYFRVNYQEGTTEFLAGGLNNDDVTDDTDIRCIEVGDRYLSFNYDIVILETDDKAGNGHKNLFVTVEDKCAHKHNDNRKPEVTFYSDDENIVRGEDSENNPLNDKYVNITFKANSKMQFENENGKMVNLNGKVMGLNSEGKAEPTEPEYFLFDKAEGQWVVTMTGAGAINATSDPVDATKIDTREFTFTNRENGASFSVKSMHALGNDTYAVEYEGDAFGEYPYNVFGKTVYGNQANRDTLIIKAADIDDTIAKGAKGLHNMDSYANWTKEDLQDRTFQLSVDAAAQLYVTENEGKDSHFLGLTAEETEVTNWRLVPFTAARVYDKDAVKYLTAGTDSVYIMAHPQYFAGGKVYAYNDTTAIVTYALQNIQNNEWLTYDPSQNQTIESMICDPNSKNYTTANLDEAYRFVLKEKAKGAQKIESGAYNIIGVNSWVRENNGKGKYVEGNAYYTLDLTKKLYGATSYQNLGAIEVEGAYVQPTSNDIFTIATTASQEYVWATPRDTVRIYGAEENDFLLYENGQFLNLGNTGHIAPAMVLDSAYVNRPGNNCYQYLLVVNPTYVEAEFDNHPNSPSVPHMIKPDTMYGRFLVNQIDSAVFVSRNHNNKFINDVEADEKEVKLGFQWGYHTGDKLFLTDGENGPVIETLNLGTADFNKAKFAFKYVNEAAGDDFKVQTAWYDYDSAVKAGLDNKEDWTWNNEGYLKSVNGVIVVTNGYTHGEEFLMAQDETNPTANESIAAEGAISVTATDGAVIIKGAEGKNVVIATILGKVVANETINSDNETIAVPAGIAVVSVDGESFKVVVK